MARATVSWGLLLPTREVLMAQGTPDLTKIIDLAVRAEALGFDSVWVGDSLFGKPRMESMALLAGLAPTLLKLITATLVVLTLGVSLPGLRRRVAPSLKWMLATRRAEL